MGTPGSSGGGGAGGTSLLSLGLHAYGAIEEGKGAKAASEYKAARLEQAAAFGKVKAAQTDAALSEELTTTLGNIDAIRAAANIDPTSPTTAAIESRQSYVSDRQRNTSVNNILRQARQDEQDAAYTRKAGEFALKQSYFKAGLGVFDGLNKMALPGGGGG